MGSHRNDDSGGDEAERDDKHRVEQSRIPAPPSGYSRIDSLDDLDVPSDRNRRPATDAETAEENGAGAEQGEQSNIKPAPTQRRSHRWNRKPSITGETPVTVDDDPAADPVEAREHPPTPVAALIDDPLPETVPTEAVRGAASTESMSGAQAEPEADSGSDPDSGATVAFEEPATPVALVSEPETVPVRTGEPYEVEAEAQRSRRITDLEDEVEELTRQSRRGTLDLGLLVLRLAVGAYLAVDGARRLFGWLDGPSLNGFETALLNTPNRAIGFDEQSAGVVAVGWSVTQIVVGIVLVFGFITPVIAALGLAVASLDLVYRVTLAGGVHLFADEKGSAAFEAALVVLLITIILCGPGRYSLDGARGWARRPGIGSVAMIIVGIAVAVGVWMLFNGTNPLTSPGNPG
ncbi:DoxX family protein [Gordonia crocea]|uniref:DoxX family protein n=1 Tax=Gordonia crocea TaxID=589162 RepID=A0A7I9UZ49_9ACTN|nr:DoxX family protein [Gordonia crocea]GED98385.1 hypothetical protein nbrc107697_24240 [Gordonia crocea]